MDLEDRVCGLAEDPFRPAWLVQPALGYAKEGVREGDEHEDARVEEHRVPRQGLLAVSACAAAPCGLERGRVVGRLTPTKSAASCVVRILWSDERGLAFAHDLDHLPEHAIHLRRQ